MATKSVGMQRHPAGCVGAVLFLPPHGTWQVACCCKVYVAEAGETLPGFSFDADRTRLVD